jgi:hypothetical protein
MTSAAQNKQQQHPQWISDRQIVNSLLAGEPTNYNLVELARLRIRYRGFPGATDIQSDLDKVMQQWGFTEADLYQKTRQIYASGQVYKTRSSKGEAEDWS